ncbi:DUF3618 domain-containing protein [Pseudomonas putida]|uniref:DUF3618 domain-containing protein n=1 Tax=Pseudomonas putida TaxID=303 RepID=A0A4D6X705_PSEPU|nr:DUF3618 domain-containing protein [Pseudomonas putida]QCI11804.1 DUF3618 domain-containing protein [Pseudomonas putida]
MSTSFEHEAQKSPDTLEQEINAKRDRISGLVDALEQRLSPGQLVDQMLAYTKGNGGEFCHNLGTTLKNNPVPTTLTALGLAWLAINQNRPFNPGPAHHGPGLGDKLGDAVDSVKGAFAQAGDKLHEATDNVRAKAHDLRDKANELGHDARDSVNDSADSLRHRAQVAGDQASALKGQVDHLLKEQPLVLAALGIALGAALGAALPSTRKEDQLLGSASDRVTDKLKANAQQAKDTVKQGIDQAGDKLAASDGQRPADTDLSSGLGFRE